MINGFIDETEKYYISNKRSIDPSEYKKQRSLEFTLTVSSFNSHEALFYIYLKDPQMSVQNLSVYALKQNTEKASEELSSGKQF